jgi:drug/metabolite transporter (DMT)-like permease
MTVALIAVLAAAICSGSAAVLQAIAVRSLPAAAGMSAGFLGRLARIPRYLAALVLIALGFALSLVALRTLPLFVVQAGRASGLAVTALLSVLILGARLRISEAVAVAATVGGLVLLALSSGEQASTAVGMTVRFALLGGVLVLGVLAWAVLRRPRSSATGLVLAVLAGLGFGALAVGARIVIALPLRALVIDPAAWAAGIGGLLGLLLGALALQRASVIAVTAAMVATETLTGAGLGMLLCGDRPVPGRAPLAVIGFAAVVAGALTLARFGAPEHPSSTPEEPGALPIG